MTSDELIAVVYHFDDSLNTQQIDEVLACFTPDATVSIVPPIPRMKGAYSGKEEIREFFSFIIDGFHVASSEYQGEGSKISWFSDVTNDYFQAIGVNPVEITCEATITEGKISHLKLTLSQESITKIIAGIGDAPAD